MQARLGVAARRFQQHVAQDLSEMKDGLGAAEQESTQAAIEGTADPAVSAAVSALTGLTRPGMQSAAQPAVQPAVQPVAQPAVQPVAQPAAVAQSAALNVAVRTQSQTAEQATEADEIDEEDGSGEAYNPRLSTENVQTENVRGRDQDDYEEDDTEDNADPPPASKGVSVGPSFLAIASQVNELAAPDQAAAVVEPLASDPEGILKVLRELAAKASSMLRIEKQTVINLDNAYHTAYEEGARRQADVKDKLSQLNKQRDELAELHKKRTASVRRLQAVHDALQQDLSKVQASLANVEHFGDTVATLAWKQPPLPSA